MKKVFIADDQIISPLGFTSEENLEALKTKHGGIKKHADKRISEEEFYAAQIDENTLFETFAQIGNPTDFTKLEQLFLLCIQGILDRNPNLDLQKTGLIISTTKGNIDVLKHGSAFPKERAKLHELAKMVQDFFGFSSKPIIISNACISGGLAISIGKRFLQSEKYKHVIVAGGDLVSEFTFSGFTSFQAISPEPCRPFSKNRSGISLGEAVAAVLLSTDVNLQTSDSIFVTGEGSANDANHISGPSRTGEGLFLSIQEAFRETGIDSGTIDFISPHGTGTIFNDEMEAIAFSRANLLEIPVHSAKGFYGHTLGASALLETIIAARSLKNNELYPSLGYDSEDLGGVSKALQITTEFKEQNLKTALKTASGFGGCNIALILQKGAVQETVHSKEILQKNQLFVQDFVHIKNNQLFHQKDIIFDSDPELELKSFLKACYAALKMDYPKFHKMDELCKLGILASEILFRNNPISTETALLLSNQASSLETDEKHQKSIQDKENYFPSPAVFVYTLPNIVLGEISIKYNLKSEQAFFITEKFDPELLTEYASILLNTGKADQVICGWIDLHKSNYNVFLSLISKEGKIPLTKTNLQKIYNQNYE